MKTTVVMQARSRALRDRGELVAGKYLLERPLAEGGMGALWVARHVELDIEVAIKFSAMGRSESHDARFRREARATARLKSPHIVQVFDYGIDRDEPYIAMELLEGESLRELLDREQRLPLERVAALVEEIAKGLSLAHEAGIVHRDLKPSNLFLARVSRELVLKILDFGIAKASAEPALPTSSIASSLASDVTRVGAVVGSPGYMSPEQAQGAPVDHRSDLWSVALVAFRMLTGSEPFVGADTAEIVGKIRAAPIPPFAIRCGAAGARVNDRDIAKNAHLDVLRREAADRNRSRGLCQELLLVDQRPVRVRAQEILGQDLVEALHIAVLHRMNVFAVERSQRANVGLGLSVCLHGTSQSRLRVIGGAACA